MSEGALRTSDGGEGFGRKRRRRRMLQTWKRRVEMYELAAEVTQIHK